MNGYLATSLIVTGSTVESVDRVWADHKLDDGQLREQRIQEKFFSGCAGALGADWFQLVADVRGALRRPPHWVVVRPEADRPTPALLVALGVATGVLSDPYRASWSRVLQEIPHRSEWSPDLEWHTDSTGWRRPSDVTAVMCLRAAAAGGATDLLSLATILETPGLEREVLRTLASARFGWPLHAELGGGCQHDVIVTSDRIRFMRTALLTAAGDGLRQAVRKFADAIDALSPDYSAALNPGDTLLFDNTRCLHRRGQLEDLHCRRLLLRTKIFWQLS